MRLRPCLLLVAVLALLATSALATAAAYPKVAPMPFPLRERVYYVAPTGGADTGFIELANADGIWTESATTKGNDSDTSGALRKLVTSNVSANSASGTAAGDGGTYTTKLGWNPEFRAEIKTGASVANIVIWVGLFSALPAGDATPAGSVIGLRFSAADDTGGKWQACANDAGVDDQTCVDTGVTIEASTHYSLRIYAANAAGTAMRVMLNGASVALITTDLPATSTALVPGIEVTTTTTATRQVDYGPVVVGSN